MNPKEFYEYVLHVTGKSELELPCDFVAWHLSNLAEIVGSAVLSELLEQGKEGKETFDFDGICTIAVNAAEKNKDEIDAEWQKFEDWCKYRKEAKNGKNPS